MCSFAQTPLLLIPLCGMQWCVIGGVFFLCICVCLFVVLRVPQKCKECCKSEEAGETDPEPDSYAMEMATPAPPYASPYASGAEISSHEMSAPIVKSNDTYETKPVHGEPILVMPPPPVYDASTNTNRPLQPPPDASSHQS